MVIVVVVLVLVSVLAFEIKLVAVLEVLQWCSCDIVLQLQMVPITLILLPFQHLGLPEAGGHSARADTG